MQCGQWIYIHLYRNWMRGEHLGGLKGENVTPWKLQTAQLSGTRQCLQQCDNRWVAKGKHTTTPDPALPGFGTADPSVKTRTSWGPRNLIISLCFCTTKSLAGCSKRMMGECPTEVQVPALLVPQKHRRRREKSESAWSSVAKPNKIENSPLYAALPVSKSCKRQQQGGRRAMIEYVERTTHIDSPFAPAWGQMPQYASKALPGWLTRKLLLRLLRPAVWIRFQKAQAN